MSEFECRSSALFNNYNWSEWLSLEDWERAYCIAFHRVTDAVTNNVTDAYTKYSERIARRRPRR